MGLNGPLSHTIFEIMRRKEKKLIQYYKNGVYVTEGVLSIFRLHQHFENHTLPKPYITSL
jgi:hypothetical protein